MVEDKTVTWKVKAHLTYNLTSPRNRDALCKGRRRWQQLYGMDLPNCQANLLVKRFKTLRDPP